MMKCVIYGPIILVRNTLQAGSNWKLHALYQAVGYRDFQPHQNKEYKYATPVARKMTDISVASF